MKKLILPATIFFSALIFLLIGVYPSYTNQQTAKLQLAEKQKTRDALDEKLTLLTNINSNQQDQDLRFVTESWPNLAPYQSVLVLLEELSVKEEVILSDMEITSAKESILIKISVKGELTNIQNFVNELAESLPVSATQTISLSKLKISDSDTPESSSSAKMAYNSIVEIDFPFKAFPKAIGKVSDPLPVISGKLSELITRLRGFNSFYHKIASTPEQVPSERITTLFPE